MNGLRQVREGVSRAWDQLGAGWHELRRRSLHALTRFHPVERRGTFQQPEERHVLRSPRWGLLASDVTLEERWIDVTVEAPGMDAGDFQIDVVGDTLRVRGEKRVARESARGSWHVMERAYGSFVRAIPLPAAVDEAAAQASYRNGVLHVRLPRVNAADTRRRVKVERA